MKPAQISVFCICTALAALASAAEPTAARLAEMPENTRAISATGFTDVEMGTLSRFKQLEELSLDIRSEVDSGWAVLRQLPKLRVVRIGEHCQVSAAALADFARISSLEVLEIEWFGDFFSDDDVKPLRSLKRLRRLKLTGFAGTEAGLKHLAECPALESLSLAYATQLTDGQLVVLKEFPQLKELELIRCEELTSALFPMLAQLAGLEALTLTPWMWRPPSDINHFYAPWTGEDLKHLLALKRLRRLTIQGANLLSNENMKSIAQLSRLEYLDISDCEGVSDDGIAHLGALPNLVQLVAYGLNEEATGRGFRAFADSRLEHLDLSEGLGCDDKGLEAIAGIHTLHVLALSEGSGRLNNGFQPLSQAKQLRHLTLRSLDVGDEDLEALSTLTSLQFLRLEIADHITDKGLRALGKLSALEQLFISDAEQVTDTGAAALAALPRLKVLQLTGSKVTGRAVAEFASRGKLEILDISASPELGSSSLDDLAKMAKLKVLHLGKCPKLPASVVKAIASCQSLEVVSLDFQPAFTIDRLAELKALPNLRSLDVNGIEKELRAKLVELFPKTSIGY